MNEFELLTGTSSCKVHNLRKRHSINYNEARTAILKSQGSELQEKQSSERKSKKRKVSTKKSELPSSRDEDDIEDENEKVEFDINIIIKQLKMQPTVEVYESVSQFLFFAVFLVSYYCFFFCSLVESW